MKKILLSLAFISLVSFANAQWVAKASFGGSARTSAVGFSIGTKGYIGTGYSGSSDVSDFWEWNQSTNTWTKKADFPGAARSGAVGFSIGTKGYIGIGSGHSDFWEWDQSTNTWTQKTDYPGLTFSGAVGFSIGTKGYVFMQNILWEWDQATDTWAQKAAFPGSSRDNATGFSIGTKGYIGTGLYNSACLSDLWEWDQATNTWTQKADDIYGGLYGMTGFSIGTIGYIGTGTDNSTGYSWPYFYKWDQTTNTWKSVTSTGFGTQEGGCVSFSIGSKGYVGTGWNDNGDLLKEFYEYTPVAGIEDFNNGNDFFVYPVPATNNLTIETSQKSTIEILNVEGQIIKTFETSSNKTTIDISTFSSGIYFIKVKTEKEVTVKKFVKE